MESNEKQLYMLIKIINVVLIVIVVMLLFTIYYKYTLWTKVYGINAKLDKSVVIKSEGLKFTYKVIEFFSILKTITIRVFYFLIFIYLRKILKSILNKELFKDDIALKLKKMVTFLLVTALVLFVLSGFVILIGTINNLDKGNFLIAFFGIGIGVFESFLLPAIIVFCISEVFIYASKIKQENDLTI